VRIVGAEEDRCPYCLTVVERNDARGVIVCPVCHTRHHADCWAVTGMCQVPHYHR
jgi:transposase